MGSKKAVMYNDQTILTSGRYKFKRLINIPADYLLNILKSGCHDNMLCEYIAANKERIESPEWGKEQEVSRVCGKIYFCDEKTAKEYMNTKAWKWRNGHKPVRAYECDKCGAWHTTSIPHNEWIK